MPTIRHAIPHKKHLYSPNNITAIWGLKIAFGLVILAPFIGYYLDYRSRPKLFISQFKNLGRFFLSFISKLLTGWL